MQRGIHYVGVCANKQHMGWLQNVVNRASLKLIMTEHSPLYDAHLATLIKVHFRDIVSSVDMQGGAQEKKKDEDDVERENADEL